MLCSVSRTGSLVTTGSPPPWKYGALAFAYLRAAQAYMLISMPTGTSTIFGAFQAISDLLSSGTAYCQTEATIGLPPKLRKRTFCTPLRAMVPMRLILRRTEDRNEIRHEVERKAQFPQSRLR